LISIGQLFASDMNQFTGGIVSKEDEVFCVRVLFAKKGLFARPFQKTLLLKIQIFSKKRKYRSFNRLV
tara:strand:+ start:16799 stop:17002 length:204 start_codon:yes stop_codon:yes gene_type:complete